MIDHPSVDQLDLFRRIAINPTYTPYSLAEEYGLSDGQALALIRIHGPSREKLDQIVAGQMYP